MSDKSTNSVRAPLGLFIAAALIVVQALVFCIDEGTVLSFAFLVVAAGLGIAVLRASRFAWGFAIIGAIGQALGVAGQPGVLWERVAGVCVALALIAPGSVRVVWGHRSSAGPRRATFLLQAFERYVRVGVRGIYLLAGWHEKSGMGGAETNQAYGVLLWRLGVACVLCFGLVLVIGVWEEDAGGGNTLLNTIGDITWVGYLLVQASFLAALGVAAYRSIRGPRRVGGAAHVKSQDNRRRS
jgi:hypothetical protein